ncbi:MAG: hypothetical protein M1840_002202 [Geoglossum simile]|nr:MAG: hypothetical protein M1840_002202 [Geoglossum simile]
MCYLIGGGTAAIQGKLGTVTYAAYSPQFIHAPTGSLQISNRWLRQFLRNVEGENPLYKDREGGDWPEDIHKENVLKCFKEWVDVFLDFAKENKAALSVQPGQRLSGSAPKRDTSGSVQNFDCPADGHRTARLDDNS